MVRTPADQHHHLRLYQFSSAGCSDPRFNVDNTFVTFHISASVPVREYETYNNLAFVAFVSSFRHQLMKETLTLNFECGGNGGLVS